MTTSSAQTTSTITLDDTITFTDGTSSYYISNGTTVSTYSLPSTVSTISVSQMPISINSVGHASDFIWRAPEEFVDCFPAWARIEAMCKEYPGLQIAFEKFKTTYYLVKDEYDNPTTKK